MVDIQKAIIARLASDTDTFAIIANRFYPSYDREADRLYPLAVYKFDITPDAAFDGASGIEYAVMRIAAVGETYKDATAVANAIHKALEAQSGVWGGVTVQGVYLQQDGIADEVDTEPTTEGIILHIRQLTFDVIYST